MPRERPEELWACLTMSAALDAEVVIHDDGSEPGMHDLEITYSDGRRAAGEVVSATDGESVGLWKLMNPPEDRWIEPNLVGGWMITLRSDARAKQVRPLVPVILRLLEGAGVREVRPSDHHRDHPLARELHLLGVRWAMQSRGTDHPGSIYVTIERDAELTGGWVDETGASMSTWIGDYLRGVPDVLGKLNRSGADERHAFVVVPGFSTAPFGVTDLLMRATGLPEADPDLPGEVTHVWVISTWAVPRAVRWSPGVGWQWFRTLVESAA